MLILSRFVDEQIKIGDDITITIVGIHGGKVKLGFEAPREVPIHRLEIFNAIKIAEEKKLLENSAEQRPVAIN